MLIEKLCVYTVLKCLLRTIKFSFILFGIYKKKNRFPAMNTNPTQLRKHAFILIRYLNIFDSFGSRILYSNVTTTDVKDIGIP